MAKAYSDLKNDIGDVTHGSISDAAWLRLINRSVSEVVNDADLKSLRRKAAVSPFLFEDIYDYSAPSDIKGQSVIDIIPQTNRDETSEFTLTSPEEFDRKKQSEKYLMSVSHNGTGKTLRVAAEVDDTTLVISDMDGLYSGGGEWKSYGDGTNLTEDSDYVVKGSSSINWDINDSGNTTAGIYNDDLDTFDITEFITGSSIFVWVYITYTTGLTNFIIRIGADASNYYTKTITTTNSGTAFNTGWNLLRFDFASSTKSGTFNTDACKYVALFMTKAGSKVSETDYRFDYLQIKKGNYFDLAYYSRYAWTESTGATRLESSTAITDLLVADPEEYNLFVLKGKQNILDHFKNISNLDDVILAKKDYKETLYAYQMLYPSESKVLINSY